MAWDSDSPRSSNPFEGDPFSFIPGDGNPFESDLPTATSQTLPPDSEATERPGSGTISTTTANSTMLSVKSLVQI